MYTNEKHNENIYKLKDLFQKIIKQFNIKINIQSSIDIDKDFVYMVMSKYFCKDIGGFSNLIFNLQKFISNKK